MHFAILGSGAVGGYYGAKLALRANRSASSRGAPTFARSANGG